MSRKLKMVALAVVAVTAFAAVSAASASAVLFHKTNMGNTTISGGQVTQNEFTIPEGAVKCSTASFTATTEETTTETLTITPTYTGCEFAALGKNSAQVTMNGCVFVIHANGVVDIECNGAGPIIVHASVASVNKCTITIPQQTNIGTVTFTNNPDQSVTVHANVTNIVYETHEGTGAGRCPATTTPTVGGTYTGSVRVTGAIGGIEERIWVE